MNANETQARILLLRKRSGMTRKEFMEYFKFKYRTLQDWELGNRICPEYLLDLMEYKLLKEGVIRADMDKEANTSSVAKSLYDKRKKCVENSNYMGNPKSNGFGQADMERSAEDGMDK